MFKTVLVEDEKNNLDLLNHFIKKYCKNIDVVASCSTYDQALSVLKGEEPDLVFLDIVLDRDTSFDLLQELGNPDFQICYIAISKDGEVGAACLKWAFPHLITKSGITKLKSVKGLLS